MSNIQERNYKELFDKKKAKLFNILNCYRKESLLVLCSTAADLYGIHLR